MAARRGGLNCSFPLDRHMSDRNRFELDRTMGLTHQEFLRSLPAAAAGMDCRIRGPQILISDTARRVEILLGKEQTQRLGSLLLPQTKVSLRLEGFSDEEREGFLRRFDLAFQRGGG